MDKRKVIIIGSGPAGLSSAIYLSRAGLSPLVIEGHESGGQLTLTTLVENFPGWPDGIMGPELMENMKKQAQRFGTVFLSASVESVDLNRHPFVVSLENKTSLSTDALVIASGASAKFLGLPHEKELTGKGISTCATCDGFFYQNKIVHVIGGGDTAMEDATVLSRFAKQVIIVHRRDKLRASKAMQDKTMNNPKISFIMDSKPVEILFDATGVNGIVLEDVKTGARQTRKTDGIFYGLGHTPNTFFLKGQIDLDENGFIKTKNGTLTNIEGVFACGDVQDNRYRQAISAAGSGCQAALDAERFIENGAH
jgi:thioredoxin reductase (NADPH)